MPWWIWLLLTLFMLAMIISGCIYVIIHGIRGLRTVSGTGAKISDRLSQMADSTEDPLQPQSAIFTEPLRVASERYADAHADVIARKERRKNRYAQVWHQWASFND